MKRNLLALPLCLSLSLGLAQAQFTRSIEVRTRKCVECPARANGWETQAPVRRAVGLGVA